MQLPRPPLPLLPLLPLLPCALQGNVQVLEKVRICFLVCVVPVAVEAVPMALAQVLVLPAETMFSSVASASGRTHEFEIGRAHV